MFRSKVISAVCLLALLLLVGDVRCECRMTDDACEFWLVVEYHMTMMRDGVAVYPFNNRLYKYDVPRWDTNNAEPIDPDHVIITDGWEPQQMVVVANGSMPGPAIEVYEGQTVIVHVTNHMRSDAVTLHWHGLHQPDTPWMDGVAYITQCPIAPGQSFTYRFKATPKGTFWYHSHIGSQLGMGLVGALIIHEKKEKAMEEFIMLLQDWNHDWDADMSHLKMEYGNYVNRRDIPATDSLEGAHFSKFMFQSGLINGRGRYFAGTDNYQAQTPLTVYRVQQNRQYRFRVIGGGNLYPFRVSVDGHRFRVIASDGYDIQPLEVESFIINPGERYDFVLDANQAPNNYWVRAETLEVNVVNHVALAVVRYQGAMEADPLNRTRGCTAINKCVVLNCPFEYYPPSEHTVCRMYSEMRPTHLDIAPNDDDVEDIFLNFAFPGNTETPASTNGVKFIAPPSPPLTQPMDASTICRAEHDCGEQKICHCALSIDLKHGKTYQFVMTNMGSGRGWAHPIHMHGHSFHVVKMGFPSYDETTGKVLSDNPDIDCQGNVLSTESFCNKPKWANNSWSGNNVPGLKLEWSPRKDTIMVPTGGYTMVRIKADNPGVWFMHCHIELHSVDGMAVMLNESFERQPAPPKGFPKCGNFEWDGMSDDTDKDGDKDKDDNKNGVKDTAKDGDDEKSHGHDCMDSLFFWVVAGVLGGLSLIQLLILSCVCVRMGSSWSSKCTGEISSRSSSEARANIAYVPTMEQMQKPPPITTIAYVPTQPQELQIQEQPHTKFS